MGPTTNRFDDERAGRPSDSGAFNTLKRLLATRPPFSIDEGVVTEEQEYELWVRSGDIVRRLADNIVEGVSEGPYVDLACIGAGAVNQAVKAVSVARIDLNNASLDLVVTPFFSTIVDDRERERTRMILRISTYPAPKAETKDV